MQKSGWGGIAKVGLNGCPEAVEGLTKARWAYLETSRWGTPLPPVTPSRSPMSKTPSKEVHHFGCQADIERHPKAELREASDSLLHMSLPCRGEEPDEIGFQNAATSGLNSDNNAKFGANVENPH